MLVSERKLRNSKIFNQNELVDVFYHKLYIMLNKTYVHEEKKEIKKN